MALGQPAVQAHRSGGHEERRAADRVVGLAATDHDEGESNEGGDPDCAPRLPCLRPQDPQQTRRAHRKEERAGEEPEQRHDLAAVVGGVLGDGAGHRELRPAVGRLPGEVRSPDQERDPDGRPRPARAHDVPASGEDQSHCQTRSQEQDRVLVLQADPGRHANGQPEAPVAAGEQLHEQPEDDRPDKQVGLGRGVEMAGAEIAGQGGRDRREDLRPPRAAEVTRDQRDEDHDERHLERGQQPDGRRRNPKERYRRGREQRRKGRLVHVPEGRMLARDDVVHLVAVEAIGTRQGHQPGEHDAGNCEHGPGNGEREAAAGWVRGSRGCHCWSLTVIHGQAYALGACVGRIRGAAVPATEISDRMCQIVVRRWTAGLAMTDSREPRRERGPPAAVRGSALLTISVAEVAGHIEDEVDRAGQARRPVHEVELAPGAERHGDAIGAGVAERALRRPCVRPIP